MEPEAHTVRTNRSTLLASAFFAAVVAFGLAFPGEPVAGPESERLANGNFEEGFRVTPVGNVAIGWHWFHNSGAAAYEFFRDTWAPVVYDGQSSQLVEINTYGLSGRDADRYAGIYQTVAVTPGEAYVLTVRGMLRALDEDPDRTVYGYAVQYGIDYNGGTDWRQVTDWMELPWGEAYPRLEPGALHSFSSSVRATTTRMTVFLRVWKKWASSDREVEVNLDGISLTGALPIDANMPGEKYTVVRADEEGYAIVENSSVSGAPKLSVELEIPAFPVVGSWYPVKVHGANDIGVTKLELYANDARIDGASYQVGRLSTTEDFMWRPTAVGRYVLRAVAEDVVGSQAIYEAEVSVGENAEFLTNGGFEQGFWATPAGMVGSGWGWFHSGGRANYVLQDDTWSPVVYAGSHSQLVGVNTLGWSRPDNDRYAGIFQSVGGLTAGADYALTIRGMLRAVDDSGDRHWLNYRVEWGYAPGASAEWRSVSSWSRIPWDEVCPLLEPGAMREYRTTFKAPASEVTLFFRVRKVWGTPDREVDVNLDAISLVGYR